MGNEVDMYLAKLRASLEILRESEGFDETDVFVDVFMDEATEQVENNWNNNGDPTLGREQYLEIHQAAAYVIYLYKLRDDGFITITIKDDVWEIRGTDKGDYPDQDIHLN